MVEDKVGSDLQEMRLLRALLKVQLNKMAAAGRAGGELPALTTSSASTVLKR